MSYPGLCLSRGTSVRVIVPRSRKPLHAALGALGLDVDGARSPSLCVLHLISSVLLLSLRSVFFCYLFIYCCYFFAQLSSWFFFLFCMWNILLNDCICILVYILVYWRNHLQLSVFKVNCRCLPLEWFSLPNILNESAIAMTSAECPESLRRIFTWQLAQRLFRISKQPLPLAPQLPFLFLTLVASQLKQLRSSYGSGRLSR